jgi:hypothetical protein
MRRGMPGPHGWFVLFCSAGCLYDADDRCGKHQNYQDEMCVCEDGYALEGSSCVEVVAPDASDHEDAGADADTSDGAAQSATGQRVPCSSPADCASYDADYCNVALRVCQVQGCTETSCDPEFLCIDLGMYIPGEPKVCLHPGDAPR